MDQKIHKDNSDAKKQDFKRDKVTSKKNAKDETVSSMLDLDILSIAERLKVSARNPFASLKNKIKSKKNDVKEDFKYNVDELIESKEDFSKDTTSKINVKSYTRSSDGFENSLIEVYQKKLPLIGNLSLSNQYKMVTGFAIVCFLGIVIGGGLYSKARTQENFAINFASEISSDLISINDLFAGIKSGEGGAYKELIKTSAKLKENFELAKSNDIFTNKSDELSLIQNRMNDKLNKVYININALKDKSAFLLDRSESVNDFSNNIQELNIKIDKFVSLYEDKSLNKQEIHSLFALKTETATMNGDLVTLLLSNKVNQNIVVDLNKTRQEFKNNLSDLHANMGITNTEELNNAYKDVVNNWVKISVGVDEIINKSVNLTQIRDLYVKNDVMIGSLVADVKQVIKIYKENDLTGEQLAIMIMVLSIIMLGFSIWVTFHIYSFEKDNKSLFDKAENNRNQSSILKLLNELMPLQDGDLTKKTTVTEEITGAIADSVNATIDSLSSLVKKIKATSSIMSTKTNEVKLISLEMLKTTEEQTESLNETGVAVIEIANAILEISNKTERGAEEARKSVFVSEEGEKQVQDAVRAMHEINKNMNETVQLVKKVGGSSKQISEIIDVLSDITESTSILALNATVQAAKAGEAGKGFKLVADSIQDLADKAGEATRRVSVLISAVQTDINAVEGSVKITTNEVDNGVSLSELAGISLNKMTLVSKGLSEMVGSISEDAKIHAKSAKEVSDNMREILKTTEMNKVSTEKTTSSISEIAGISEELGESVQSFKIE
jgi:twitching motility protein PilJ